MKSRFSKFLILSLALTAFLAGYLIMNGDFGNKQGQTTGTILDKFGDAQSATHDSQLATEDNGPVLLVNRAVVSATNSRGGESVLYYEKNTGRVFELDLTSRIETTVSDNFLTDFISTNWSPTKKEAVGLFRSQTGQEFKYYNFGTREMVTFSPNIKSVAFSPDGSLIAYYYFDGEPIIPETSYNPVTEEEGTAPPAILAGKIMISEPNGKYQKKIIDTRIQDIKISWPAKDQIVLETPLFEIFLLSEEGKLYKFLEPKPFLEKMWSKSGKKMLFSTINDPNQQESMLFIKSVETREETPLQLTGSASKCRWGIDDITLFCALSKSPSEDEIYKINTLDNSRELIAEPGFLVKEVFLSSLENHLLFVSAVDEKLYGTKISD